jgi:hypothetical protein
MAQMATMCFDNLMSWFRSTKDGCWFPDYVVQKDASYGPVGGRASSGTGGAQWGPPAWFGNAKGGAGGAGVSIFHTPLQMLLIPYSELL